MSLLKGSLPEANISTLAFSAAQNGSPKQPRPLCRDRRLGVDLPRESLGIRRQVALCSRKGI